MASEMMTTADTLEMLADDVVRRARIRARHDANALGEELAAAIDRLAAAVDARANPTEPTGDQALIEQLGKRIRALEAQHKADALELARRSEKLRALADDREQIAADHARCLAPPTEAEKAEKLKPIEGLAYWTEPCIRCGQRRVDHAQAAGAACPSKPTQAPAQAGDQPTDKKIIGGCLACGGGPAVRRNMHGRLVWWCASCASLGGHEDAGIRGLLPPGAGFKPEKGE